MKKSTFLNVSKILSPDFYIHYNEIMENRRSLKTHLKLYENNKVSLDACIKFINSIIEINEKEFLRVDFNKDKRLVVSYIEDDTCNNNYNVIVEEFILEKHRVVYKLELSVNILENKIYIIDNHATIFENRGNGSIGLKSLIQYAINKNYKAIAGDISNTDWKDVDKLRHFYENQKFLVKLNYEIKHGSIRWENPKINQINYKIDSKLNRIMRTIESFKDSSSDEIDVQDKLLKDNIRNILLNDF
jgi:hypothetical protein